MDDDLRRLTTKTLGERVRDLAHAIEAGKQGLLEGINFYGANNPKIAQQIREDEAALAALQRECDRRLHDQENTYR